MDSLSISGALNITNATVDFNQLGGALPAGAHVFATYGSLAAAFASVLDLPAGFSINYHYLGGNQIALVGCAGWRFLATTTEWSSGWWRLCLMAQGRPAAE